jgi:hypothetical protein
LLKFGRDHVLSKAALKERAPQRNRGTKLTKKQIKAIEDSGMAIAIPKERMPEPAEPMAEETPPIWFVKTQAILPAQPTRI